MREVPQRRTFWILGALLFFCLVFAHQKKFDSATPVSRLDLLHALWEHQSFSIDAYHTNTPDKAFFQGHYYSDKAPGTVAVALPAFAVSAQILNWANIPLDSPKGWLISSWLSCAGSLALVTAIGGVALYAWLCRWTSARAALITVLALFLGAAPLPYSTMMFSHALVIGLICICMWAIGLGEGQRGKGQEQRGKRGGQSGEGEDRGGKGDEQRENGEEQTGSGEGQRGKSEELCGKGEVASVQRVGWGAVKATEVELLASSEPGIANRPPIDHLDQPMHQTRNLGHGQCTRRDVLAGFAGGLALASEFSSGLVIVGLFLWLAAEDWRRGFTFTLLGAIPLLLVPAYSLACFGNPFILPYSLQASFPQMRQGLYAIQWPDAQTAWNLLFSPARGLLFWSPFLVMAGFGYWAVAVTSTRLFVLTYFVPLLQVIVISGRVWDWQAGFVLGPRLLAPMLPLLALPCALGVRRWPKLGLILAAYSIAITTMATLTDAAPNTMNYNPLTELHIPDILNIELSPNLGMLFGFSPYLSAFAFYAILGFGLWRILWQQGMLNNDIIISSRAIMTSCNSRDF
ncbi:MAG: hypothetical protein M1608_06025 [Candidatus Omnitrophica bacterium]|nr:hypothetical protein [Candidatus Omnitrophota bacterium]